MEAITSEDMAALEDNAEYLGVSKLQLMECAGKAVADIIESLGKGREIAIYAGTGRNGGDGMVAARHLASRGFKVTLILVGGEERIVDPSTTANWKAVKTMEHSVKLIVARDSAEIPEVKAPIIVDALLGTGARGKL
ncbi:MAG: NAD(P)H-hydrate epimerase, partial [Candidatus Hecatellaceae archaeon]